MPIVLIDPPRQNKKKRYSNVLLSPCTSSLVIYMDDLLDSNPWCSLVSPVADDNIFPAQGTLLASRMREGSRSSALMVFRMEGLSLSFPVGDWGVLAPVRSRKGHIR